MREQPLVTKPCPSCGRRLVIRQNRKTGHEFLGCPGWPTDCKHTTEPLPESIRMRAAGHPTLPGLA